MADAAVLVDKCGGGLRAQCLYTASIGAVTERSSYAHRWALRAETESRHLVEQSYAEYVRRRKSKQSEAIGALLTIDGAGSRVSEAMLIDLIGKRLEFRQIERAK